MNFKLSSVKSHITARISHQERNHFALPELKSSPMDLSNLPCNLVHQRFCAYWWSECTFSWQVNSLSTGYWMQSIAPILFFLRTLNSCITVCYDNCYSRTPQAIAETSLTLPQEEKTFSLAKPGNGNIVFSHSCSQASRQDCKSRTATWISRF